MNPEREVSGVEVVTNQLQRPRWRMRITDHRASATGSEFLVEPTTFEYGLPSRITVMRVIKMSSVTELRIHIEPDVCSLIMSVGHYEWLPTRATGRCGAPCSFGSC